MPPVLAYFLTWRTYGDWLHGDDRGCVDVISNRPGAPYVAPDQARHARAASRMTQAPFRLSDAMREVVDVALADHCAFRSWQALAKNVRTNHVHIVVNCRGSHAPEEAMKQLKGIATRRLIGEGLIERGRRVWADHGSTRWLGTPESVQRAVEYAVREQ